MGSNARLLFAVLSILLASTSGFRVDTDVSLEDPDLSSPELSESPKTNDPRIEDVQNYLHKVSFLYSKTKRILENLKNTVKNDLDVSTNLDDIDLSHVHGKRSFYKPYLRRVMRINARSLIKNMMRNIERKLQRRG